MLNTEIQTETTVLILNLEIGFKKLMHIIYTQVQKYRYIHVHYGQRKGNMILEKKPRQTDRQTDSEILFKTNIRPQ